MSLQTATVSPDAKNVDDRLRRCGAAVMSCTDETTADLHVCAIRRFLTPLEKHNGYEHTVKYLAAMNVFHRLIFTTYRASPTLLC